MLLSVYFMMAPWGSSIITIHHTKDRSLSMPFLYITLFSSWIKYQSGVCCRLGSWEVLLCRHLGCLFTSHSCTHCGCFWLSAAIWNANRFLSVKLKTFFLLYASYFCTEPCLSYGLPLKLYHLSIRICSLNSIEKALIKDLVQIVK